jgi:hypothetical protein
MPSGRTSEWTMTSSEQRQKGKDQEEEGEETCHLIAREQMDVGILSTYSLLFYLSIVEVNSSLRDERA